MPDVRRRYRSTISLISSVAAVILLLVACTPAAPQTSPGSTSAAPVERAQPQPTRTVVPTNPNLNYLHTEGAKIVDSKGQEVVITGISWFGMETDTLAPHGLWSRKWEDMLNKVVELGYNTIRLPFSNELFDPSLEPRGIDYALNPDLEGLNGLQIMDKIVTGAGERGIKIILDQHRPTTDDQSKLWYTDELTEEQWIADWKALARRYKDNDTVVGADLHNEPAGDATWGTDDPKTDWRLAAERAGNAILDVNPNWLIVVEGIEKTEDDFGNVLDWYWMGGSLQAARYAPVRLNVPGRLVYSAHDYGPGVYLQGWFQDPEFPANLPGIWDHHWGYLAKEGIAPVLLGEFGGQSVGDDAEGIWQRELVKYLKANGISYTYWSLNGNSGDTGGILGDDWKSVNQDKQALLASYQSRMMPVQNPRAVDKSAVPIWHPDTMKTLKALHQDKQDDKWATAMLPEVYVSNKAQTELDLRDVELRYWYNPGREAATLGPSGQVVTVDWAGIGIGEGAKDVPKEKVKTEVVVDPEGRGVDPLFYVRVTFAEGLSVPKRAALGVRLRIENKSGAPYFQESSYSYRRYHWPVEWDRVGIFKGGKQVWGVEPNVWDAQQKQKLAEKQNKVIQPRS